MKPTLKSFAVLVLGALWAATALADIRQGYFRGDSVGDGSRDVRIFIRTHGTGNAQTTYGLIVEDDDGASVFRIEELDDGTQAWVQLFQASNFILSADISQEATYSGVTFKTRFGGDRLRLTPTAFGRKVGCSREYIVKPKGGLIWQSPPKKDLRVTGSSDSELQVKPISMMGNFKLDGVSYNGTFSLKELVPGISLLRAKGLNAESADGKAMEKEITAVVATVYHDRLILWNYSEIYLVRLKPGVEKCLSAYTNLD